MVPKLQGRRLLAAIGLLIFLLVILLWRGLPNSVHDAGYNIKNSIGGKKRPIADKYRPQESDLTVAKDADDLHREIYSIRTSNKRYFHINFISQQGYNPNFLPHPTLRDTWIVVAQLQRSNVNNTVWFAQLVCDATFQNDSLVCLKPPLILPIAATIGGKCKDNLQYFPLNVGPHDARVFYGPHHPYALYGSNSAFTCFGQFIQDFRMLYDWGRIFGDKLDFHRAVELQRPTPYSPVEKNWFLFWSQSGEAYVHQESFPDRLFTKVKADGSVGTNLARRSAAKDEDCMALYMPPILSDGDTVHQATNSLRITFCNRADPACEPHERNTFIFHIFQHKSVKDWHYTYEPYIMVFRETAPFEIHAISEKPLWFHGRGHRGNSDGPLEPQMLYVTSMAWSRMGQKYHGYLDDTIFIGFGYEDTSAAAIDVKARDLFQDLGFCEHSF